MMKLAVVTLTRGDHHQWFDAMAESVATALPEGAEHIILQCTAHEHIEPMRWGCFELAEYVAFVDDDDLVLNNSLRLCLNALELNPDVAVAFTDERYIDAEGNTINSPHDPDRRLQYEHMYMSPQTVHHLVMIRSSAVDREGQRLNEILGIGGEWLMKVGAAIKGGAIHVPIEGYAWRRHDGQHSSADVWKAAYGNRLHLLVTYLAAQIRQPGTLVPRLAISS